MVGKFLLGMVSGGLVVTGGLLVGSILFPTQPANDNIAALEQPIATPTPATADAGATAVEQPPVEEPAAEPPPAQPEPTSDEGAGDEPPTEPMEDPAAAPAAGDPATAPEAPAVVPETASEPATTAAPQPEVDVPVAPQAPAESAAPTEPLAPPAAEVAKPETLAEPSKPAAAEADVAATPPEAPTETLLAEAAPPPAMPEPAVEAPPAAESEPEAVATPVEAAPIEAPPVEVEAAAPAPAEPAPDVPGPDLAPASDAAPDALPAPDAAPADEIVTAEATPAPEAPTVEAPAPETPAADPAPAAETLPAEIAPEATVPDMPGTRPAVLPGVTAAPEPEAEAEGKSSTFKPTPGLPRAGETAGEAPAEPDTTAPPADPRPIAQYAAAFENPDAKPPFAIVLIDDGSADLDRADLAALPFPVSFALDPLDPASAAHAAIYRAAGKEVVMLVTGIAQGAMPADVEVAFQSMAQGLPEAVAVMDQVEPSFQNRRPLAATVVPILKDQGRGLLTWDEGLNAADQVARREDLEAAVIFRDLGTAGAEAAAMRRLLDRAVFKAGQDGRVSVVGKADPATVAALLEWTVEGKAATVALAPVTAVLTVE